MSYEDNVVNDSIEVLFYNHLVLENYVVRLPRFSSFLNETFEILSKFKKQLEL